jgi:flagellar biosynthesis/type III secretory pathway protein FliH
MASAQQQLIQKGFEKGIEQGKQDIQQGIERTQRTLLRLLHARFGPLDAAFLTRIGKADADALDRWIDRELVAQRIDDIFDD